VSVGAPAHRASVAALIVALGVLIAAGVMGARLVGVMRGTDARTRTGKPNLLVVTLDTCRKDRLSVYGNARNTSPALVALAGDGFVFDNAFTVATNSAPSHATIFTGLYPFQHGLVDNGLELPKEIPTLAKFLSAAGYDTAGFVGYDAVGAEALFDQGFGTFRMDEIDEHGHATRTIEGETRSFAAALDWMKAWQRKGPQGGDAAPPARHDPFFVWLHAQQMHEADPPKPYDSLFLDVPRAHDVAGFGRGKFDIRCFDDVSSAYLAGNLTQDLQSEAIALYDGEVRLVDDQLAAIVAFLKDAGLYDDTVIVAVADHGEMFFEKPGGDFGTIEPGHTAEYFDQILRVPLIVKPAQRSALASGVRLPQMVSTVDVLPTILELLHYERFPWLAGRSRMPLMRDPRERTEERIFFEEAPWEMKCAGMRTPEWKLIMKSEDGRDHVALIDLANDPREERDVSRVDSAQAETMLQTVRKRLESQDTVTPSSYADMSEKMRDELRRAGYLRDKKP